MSRFTYPVAAADNLAPGFVPEPKLIFTSGSPRLPWQSCANTGEQKRENNPTKK